MAHSAMPLKFYLWLQNFVNFLSQTWIQKDRGRGKKRKQEVMNTEYHNIRSQRAFIFEVGKAIYNKNEIK